MAPYIGMPPYKKRNAMRKKTYRKPTVKKFVRKAKKTAMARTIRRVVGRMVETKVANYTQSNFALTGCLSSGFQGTIKVLNPCQSSPYGQYFINQGTGQGQRVGNEITTIRATMSGVVHINTAWDGTQNYNMCPLYVLCLILRNKTPFADTQQTIYDISQNRLFQAGSSSTGLTGFLNDLTKEINTDQVQLLKRRVFRVGVSNVVSAFAVNSANNANQQFGDSQATISQMFRMDVTKCFYKKYQFNDATNDVAQKNTWVLWCPFRVDGNEILTSLGARSGTIPCYVDYNIKYEYKDQ